MWGACCCPVFIIMRRSWFTASLPHDKHRFDEGRPDRFEAPKASLNFSSNGTCAYGLPERPCLRALRTEFEARTSRSNELQERLHFAAPGGRRHAAQKDYLLHMDAEARGDRSVDRVAARGARRCQHNARVSRARGESADSPLRHPWNEAQRPATASSGNPAAPYMAGTGRIFSPAGLVTATSLDMQPGACPMPDTPRQRHAAHARFEAGHHADAQARHGRRHHDTSRPSTAAAAEAALLHEWPLGLPSKELRAARAQGLSPAPLGFGIGASACRIPAIMSCP